MSQEIMTPKAILSYPSIWTPTPGPQGGEAKYRAVLIFEEGADLSAIKQAVLEAATEKWGSKAAELFRTGKIRNPFRTDWEAKGYPENSTFISASSKFQPGVVSRYADSNGNPMVITEEGPEELYAGCYVRAYIRPFAYDTAGNRGVSFNLGNIQKLGDGDRMDGRKSAAHQFEALEDLGAADAPFGPPSVHGHSGPKVVVNPDPEDDPADRLAELFG